MSGKNSIIKFCRGRRGEEEIEKGPVDRFPSEPNDEVTCDEETLDRLPQANRVQVPLPNEKRTKSKI